MKIQNYKEGEIHRINNRYLFYKKEKIVGIYDSVKDLVANYKEPRKRKKKLVIK